MLSIINPPLFASISLSLNFNKLILTPTINIIKLIVLILQRIMAVSIFNTPL